MSLTKITLLLISVSCLVGGNAPQNVRDNIELKFLDNTIEISLENNDIRGSLYDQLQKILRQKEIDFIELNNFIQSAQSGYESTNDVTEFQEKIELLRSDLANDIQNIFNNSTGNGSVKKRSARKILRNIVFAILKIISFFSGTTSTTTSSTTATEPSTSEQSLFSSYRKR